MGDAEVDGGAAHDAGRTAHDGGPTADAEPDGCTERTFFGDADGDGFGTPESTTTACSAPDGFVDDSTDCDDDCTSCHPGGTEACDGRDNDCDEDIDEELTRDCGSTSEGVCELGTQTCGDGSWGECIGAVEPGTEECDGTLDEDCDGTVDEGCTCTSGDSRDCGTDEGECTMGTQTCTAGSWGACVGATGPSTEVCDGADNDCDGMVDEGETVRCYRDVDMDGYASLGAATMDACSCPAGWTSRAPTLGQRDCDDGDADRYDGAPEVCDSKDNDCDSDVDDGIPTMRCYLDADGDGYGLMDDYLESCACPSGRTNRDDAFDCHDGNVNAYPGQTDFFAATAAPDCTGVCHLSWADFNCDGEAERLWDEGYMYCYFESAVPRCYGGGWESTIPGCGFAAEYRYCVLNATMDGCTTETERRGQRCR